MMKFIFFIAQTKFLNIKQMSYCLKGLITVTYIEYYDNL
jgi:hypothetical protein